MNQSPRLEVAITRDHAFLKTILVDLFTDKQEKAMAGCMNSFPTTRGNYRRRNSCNLALAYFLACFAGNDVDEINPFIIFEDPELSFHGNKISINLILLPLHQLALLEMLSFQIRRLTTQCENARW